MPEDTTGRERLREMLRDVLAEYRRYGDYWNIPECPIPADQMARWREVAGMAAEVREGAGAFK